MRIDETAAIGEFRLSTIDRRDFLALLAGSACSLAAPATAAAGIAANSGDGSSAGGAGEILTPKLWSALLDRLKTIDRFMADTWSPDDPVLRQRLYRHTLMTLAQGYLMIFEHDNDYPDWVPFTNQGLPSAGTVADNMYYMSFIDGHGVHRISGYRGTVALVTFHWTEGLPGAGWPSKLVAHTELDKMTIRKNGYFEFVFSPERPQGYTGDWLQVDSRARGIVVRSIARDWFNEVDPRLCIERLDIAPGAPATMHEPVTRKLERLLQYVDDYTRLFGVGRARELKQRGLLFNRIGAQPLGSSGENPLMFKWLGSYELGPDEALILEAEAPKKVRYWQVMLLDELHTTVDFANRQSSLNDFQAKLDKDGMFRAVIANEDPGVPNWLDPGGLKRGIIQGRWLEASSNPIPTLTKVKLGAVRQHLPADTAIVTPQQRDALLRKRRQGAAGRRRW